MGLRILFVRKRYDAVGGVQTQLRLVAKELAKKHSVAVATIDESSKSAYEALFTLGHLRTGLRNRRPSHRDENVEVYNLTTTPRERLRSIAKRPLSQTTGRAAYPLTQLRSLAVGMDIIHGFGTGGLIYAAQEIALSESIPFVNTPYVHPGEGRSYTKLLPFFQRCNAVFGLLETDVDYLASLGVKPDSLRISGVVPILPANVNAQDFRARHGLVGKPLVLFIGRMLEFKGVPAILSSASRIWRVMPEVHFVFVGPNDSQASQWFADIDDSRIHYLGPIGEQEKGDALAACDLFCMPSSKEILPAVYLEAWYYGKAVVGGPAPGLKELIEGNAAGVVVEQNPDSIARTVVELLSNDPRRRLMGENGRKYVRRHHSKEAFIGSLEQAYKDIVRTHTKNTSDPPSNSDLNTGP